MTTIPPSIRKPIIDGMLILQPATKRLRNEPISANGIQNMTIREKMGDSNCMAMTINTSRMPVRVAISSEVSSSIWDSILADWVSSTPAGNSRAATCALTSVTMVRGALEAICPVTVTR